MFEPRFSLAEVVIGGLIAEIVVSVFKWAWKRQFQRDAECRG